MSNLWKQECTQYIVVDAGSSGSRLHVFDANYDEIFYKRTEPGVSQYKHTYQAIRSIESLLHEIPKTKCSKYAFLHATAGVRLMKKNKRVELMSNLRQYLNEKNGITWKNISILSGYEEAVNEWKAASYLSPDKSIGIIGLGGASLQIAFRQKNNSIFAKSWPHYGLNEAKRN